MKNLDQRRARIDSALERQFAIAPSDTQVNTDANPPEIVIQYNWNDARQQLRGSNRHVTDTLKKTVKDAEEFLDAQLGLTVEGHSADFGDCTITARIGQSKLSSY